MDNFETDLDIPAIGEPPFRGVFIRASIITSTEPGVEVLSEIPAGPVLVRQGRLLGGAFHAELTDDSAHYALFLQMVTRDAPAAWAWRGPGALGSVRPGSRAAGAAGRWETLHNALGEAGSGRRRAGFRSGWDGRCDR